MNEPTPRSRGQVRPASPRRMLLGAAVIGSMMLAAGCHSGPGPQHTEVDGGGKTLMGGPSPSRSAIRHNGDPAFPIQAGTGRVSELIAAIP
jgi:hypothetical protein